MSGQCYNWCYIVSYVVYRYYCILRDLLYLLREIYQLLIDSHCHIQNENQFLLKSVLSRTFLVFYCVYFVPFQNVLIFEIQRWLSVEVVVTLSVLAGPPTESDRQSKNHQILWNSNIIAVSLLKIYKNFKTWEHIVETVWKIWEWRLTERDQNLYNHYWSSPDPWTKNLPGSIHLVSLISVESGILLREINPVVHVVILGFD